MSLYRVLLRLLPPGFRREFGDDMEGLYRERLREAGDSATRRAGVRVRAVLDLLRHTPGEWLALARREADGGSFLRGLPRDLRYAARSLRRTPGFTAVALLTLTLGVGANAAVFSVVHTVLMEPLPYEDPDGLVLVWPETNSNRALAQEVARRVPAVEGVSGISNWSFTLTGDGYEPEELSGSRVFPGHFRTLGVEPLLGRTFTDDDAVPGNEGVVVLGHGLWTRRFGGDPGVVGRTIELSGGDRQRHTVIGVLPPDFRPVIPGAEPPTFWVPMPLDPSLSIAEDNSWWVNWRVARLAPGATLEQATAQLRAAAVELRAEAPSILDEEDVRAATVEALRDHQVADVSTTLWVLLGVVGLLLLMACANVANLLLARGEARLVDLAVRTALGAGRGRLAREMLTESALLGLAGAALGVLAAVQTVEVLGAAAPATLPRAGDLAVDGPVLAFSVAVTTAAVALFGVLPAFRSARRGAAAAARSAPRGAARGGHGLARALVGVQVALAVVVIAASGLMLRSVGALFAEDPGMRAAGVVVFRTQPPSSRYPGAADFHAYYDRLEERLRSVPGVASVAGIQLLPGTTSNWSFPTHFEGRAPAEDGAVPSVNFRVVTPGYFGAVGIPLLRGRTFETGDRDDGEPVVVVNQALVDRYWPDRDPLGRVVRFFSETAEPRRVVGVVGNVRQHGLALEPRPEVYLPARQYPYGATSLWMMARTEPGAGDLGTVQRALREATWEIDPDVPISGMSTLDRVLAESIGDRRFAMWLLSAFAALALVLGVLGVYGVAAYAVGRRRRELGVRMALGASRLGVVGAALRGTLGPVAAGVVAGALGALAAGGVMESLLYGVAPRDPTTLIAVVVLMAGAAVLATALPAWRAGRTDVREALQAE